MKAPMHFLAALPEPSRFGDVLMAFLSIVFEGAPYILLGTILSGLIDAFLPAKLLERVLPKNKGLATIMAGFLGLIFPVCECAIVPVIRRLVQKGLPLSCAVTYMLAAPIVNPVVLVSTMTAFKEFQGLDTIATAAHPNGILGALADTAPMSLSRMFVGYIVAVLVGLVVMRFKPAQVLKEKIVESIEKGAIPVDGPVKRISFDSKLVHAMRTAMRDFLDTGMYFAIGVMITSVFNTQVNQAILDRVASNEFVALPSIMMLAMVLSLCSTSDAFIAAPMASFTFAAKLAFLVFGPMMDIKLLFMYSSVFKRRVVVALFLGLLLVIGLLVEPWAAMIEHLAKK